MKRSRRKAWQTLLWTAVGLLALQFGLGAAIEGWLVGVRDPEYVAKETNLRARLAEAPGRPLVLVLGSSRTLLGVQAGQVQEVLGPDGPVVFNFGLQGSGPLRQLIALKRLRAAGIRPEFVFLEVLPPFFNQTGDLNQEEWWLQGERLSLGEIHGIARWHSDTGRLVRDWAKARLAPSLRHAEGFHRALGLSHPSPDAPPEQRPTDGHGWLELFSEGLPPAQVRQRTENARRQYEKTFRDFRLAERPAQALEEVLTCCRRDGIPVALFLMPEGSAFRSWCPPRMIAGYEAYFHDLCRSHNLPLVDARGWIGDDGFWDSHHLFPFGAARFSERWTREGLQALALPMLHREPRGVLPPSP